MVLDGSDMLLHAIYIAPTHNPCAYANPPTNHIPVSFPVGNPTHSSSSCPSGHTPLCTNTNPYLFQLLSGLY